jgi:FkbM family methyltransferase
MNAVTKYLRIFPHKNRTFIDIGSFTGNYIIEVSQVFKRAIGYEPSNKNYGELVKNTNAIKNIEIFNMAICERPEFGSLHGSPPIQFHYKPDIYGKVLCKSLDQECLEKRITEVDFLNVDVNGCELFVFNGAMETIKTWKPLIRFNMSNDSLKNYSVYPMDAIKLLSKIGYTGFDNSDPDHLFMYCPNETHCVVPRRLFTFWTGYNPMSENRKKCLNNLRNNTDANVLLIDVYNYEDYILQIAPLHPAFPYLSETHKADYLRAYFMHYYGGGYSDIKYATGSWLASFDEMSDPGNINIICGYKEIGPHGVPVAELREHWEALIGGGCYIAKPNTEFTKKWYNRMVEVLDKKLEALKQNPAKHPQDCSEEGTGYPLAWQEILGVIFHRVCYEERDKISQSLPILLFHSYR